MSQNTSIKLKYLYWYLPKYWNMEDVNKNVDKNRIVLVYYSIIKKARYFCQKNIGRERFQGYFGVYISTGYGTQEV